MIKRLSPAFSTHLKPTTKPSADHAKRNARDEEAATRLAMALHLQGRLHESEQLCLQILSVNPRNAKALYLAGRIALESRNFIVAEQRLERAAREAPREPLILVALGEACRHDHEMAIRYYLKALSIRPDLVEAHYRLGRAYAKRGNAEKAVEQLEKLLRLDGNHENARCALAGALASLGREDEASAMFRESIRLRKAVDSAYSGFTKMQEFSSEPPELTEIVQELERNDLKPREVYLLRCAAGKILNDLKRYDEAFDQFEKGNRANGEAFDLNEYRQFVQGLIDAFSPEFFRSKAGLGDTTEVPVFVVGMPRSGKTTLTEQICSSHPVVHGAGELKNLDRVVRRAGFKSNSPGELRGKLAAMTPQQSRTMAADYLRDVLKLAPRASRIVDEMPHNFERLGFIALLFPKARIIHCRRDPVDTCVSCFMTSLSDRHAYKTDLTRLGLYYREYDRLMRHWNAVLPGRIHEIRYEALVADQEAKSRRLIDFLGLPWDDACLRFEENDRVVNTASRWQVREPLYNRPVKLWKNYGHKIQPLVEALGDLATVEL